MQDATRTSGVDALTRGILYLQKLGKEGQRLAATFKHKLAVDQKKAKGKHIRYMVKFADLESMEKLPPPVKGCTLQLLHTYINILRFILASVQAPGQGLGGASSVNSRYAEQF